MIGPLAYMDPGTGSLFLQLLLGGVAGFLVFVKLFWHRILSLLGLQKETPETATEPQVDAEPPE